MNKAYLLIGGNMGDRRAMLEQAKKRIKATCGNLLHQSSIYETEAWGKTDQAAFLNQVLEISTALPPGILLDKVLQIEKDLGRQRLEKYGPRLMDIDILLYDNQVIDLPNLVVPHPQMAARRFVLTPLAELAPDYLHPVTNLSIQEMLDQCKDPLHVYKW